jgi:hypothetical protein
MTERELQIAFER